MMCDSVGMRQAAATSAASIIAVRAIVDFLLRMVFMFFCFGFVVLCLDVGGVGAVADFVVQLPLRSGVLSMGYLFVV